jgi:hypothetical protein
MDAYRGWTSNRTGLTCVPVPLQVHPRFRFGRDARGQPIRALGMGRSGLTWPGLVTRDPAQCPLGDRSTDNPRHMRTREGMAVARSKGKLKGKKPKLTARQQAELVRMRADGEYSIADLMEMFSIGRATVYRVLERASHGSAREHQ